MNTMQILSAAYAEIFGVEVKKNGCYHDQKTGASLIDYAHFDLNPMPYDIDTDYFECVTEDGSEGCWVRVDRVRYDKEKREYIKNRVGTIKTLDEGRCAWKDMGALAGELAYVANNITAWKLYKAEQQNAQQEREA